MVEIFAHTQAHSYNKTICSVPVLTADEKLFTMYQIFLMCGVKCLFRVEHTHGKKWTTPFKAEL